MQLSETQQQFQDRLTAVLVDIGARGRHDREATLLVGRIADSILRDAGARNWSRFARSLKPKARSALLATIQEEGNRLGRERKDKAVYALQVIATALVAPTLEAPTIASGGRLVDSFIQACLTAWRKTHRPASAQKTI